MQADTYIFFFYGNEAQWRLMSPSYARIVNNSLYQIYMKRVIN